MALIEAVSVTEPKDPESGHFHVRIHLGITQECASAALPKLMKWHQTSCIADPKKYEEELAKAKLEFVPIGGTGMFEVKFTGDSTQDYKLTWVNGLDALHMDDSGRHLVFSEYIKDTPVTRAIVAELHRVSLEKTDSKDLDPLASYVEPLLVCLYMHWD